MVRVREKRKPNEEIVGGSCFLLLRALPILIRRCPFGEGISGAAAVVWPAVRSGRCQNRI